MKEIMTAEEFAKKMEKLSTIYDVEERHLQMDYLLIEVLRQLGYNKGCDIWVQTDMWFA